MKKKLSLLMGTVAAFIVAAPSSTLAASSSQPSLDNSASCGEAPKLRFSPAALAQLESREPQSSDRYKEKTPGPLMPQEFQLGPGGAAGLSGPAGNVPGAFQHNVPGQPGLQGQPALPGGQPSLQGGARPLAVPPR